MLFCVGMEVAAYLCGKAASVSCIDIAAVPFERVLGTRIGKMLQGVSGSMMSSVFSPLFVNESSDVIFFPY